MIIAAKRRIIKDFNKLDIDFQNRVRKLYPDGFEDSKMSFYDMQGKKVTAIPFETDDTYYLLRLELHHEKVNEEDLSDDGDDDIDENDDTHYSIHYQNEESEGHEEAAMA